jgi:hypothetical protein
MKRELLTLTSVLFLAARTWSAPVDLVDVAAPEINCLFSPTCSLVVMDTLSPLVLPGTSGTGVLQSRVFVGEPGSSGAGVYGYEYRVDLTGVTATNIPPCFTNSIRCFTNRVKLVTEVVRCRTNAVGVSNVLVCITNAYPGTNFTFCVTNVFPATNVIRCLTNAVGAITCFTNFFPGSNVVACVTSRIPGRTNILCATNRLTGSNIVVCTTTNRVRSSTNIVTCYTNSIPCPGTTPCIETLRIPFGRVYTNLNFGTGGLAAVQAYVVTNGGVGIAPVFAQKDGDMVRLEFAPPICPGDSSLFIGLFSTNPPTDVRVSAALTSGSNAVLAARGPTGTRGVVDCDLGPLIRALNALSLRDIVAPNDNARAGRRGALLNRLEAARQAADAGQADDALEAVKSIAKKAGRAKNSWLTSDASRRLDPILDDLLDCLRAAVGKGDHDDDDHDHDDDDDDDRDGSHRRGGNPN